MKHHPVILVLLLLAGCKADNQEQNFCLEANQEPALTCKEELCPPIILGPENCATFDFYPRELHYQWTSNATLDADAYELVTEISTDYLLEHGEWDDNIVGSYSHILPDTFYDTQFPGAQPGRWRVRSIHGQDTSAWSAWHYLRFVQ